MRHHRIAFHFVDESTDDRELWEQWMRRVDPVVRGVVKHGERRPFIQIAAPFAHSYPISTRRADEAAGLIAAGALVKALIDLAASTGRSIGVLFSAQPLGVINSAGAAAAIEEKLSTWGALVAARPPDEPEWEREGMVSIWAGVLSRDEAERLLHATPTGTNDAAVRVFGLPAGEAFIFLPTNTCTSIAKCKQSYPAASNGACPLTVPCP